MSWRALFFRPSLAVLLVTTLVILGVGVRILTEQSRAWPGSEGLAIPFGVVVRYVGVTIVLALPLWALLWIAAQVTCKLLRRAYDSTYTPVAFFLAVDLSAFAILWVAPRFA